MQFIGCFYCLDGDIGAYFVVATAAVIKLCEISGLDVPTPMCPQKAFRSQFKRSQWVKMVLVVGGNLEFGIGQMFFAGELIVGAQGDDVLFFKGASMMTAFPAAA